MLFFCASTWFITNILCGFFNVRIEFLDMHSCTLGGRLIWLNILGWGLLLTATRWITSGLRLFARAEVHLFWLVTVLNILLLEMEELMLLMLFFAFDGVASPIWPTVIYLSTFGSDSISFISSCKPRVWLRLDERRLCMLRTLLPSSALCSSELSTAFSFGD